MNTLARIATVCQNETFYPTVEQNRAHVLGLLDLALACRPDLVCLPETFTTSGSADRCETVPGPTVEIVSQKAREHRCYVICPIKTAREGRCWNSAILIGRAGEIVGIYDKAHPVTSTPDYTLMEGGLCPGPTPPPVFDLDFGRVGIQICFDAGFPEGWQALADQDARLVFWPSAYNGGFALQVYAYLHHMYVVSAVHTDSSRIIDPLGQILQRTDRRLNVIYRDINLDYCVSHWDFNYSIPDRIIACYGERVEVRSDCDSAHFLVEPRDPQITIAQLQQEFGFESTAQYYHRHREAYPTLRAGQKATPQTAAHGDRPQYGKYDICPARSSDV